MKCLIVEDDAALRFALSEQVAQLGHDVVEADSVAAATLALRTKKFDLILLDFMLPDGNCIAVSDYASFSCPGARIIMLTGSEAFPRGENKLLAPGIDWIMRKPLPMNDLAALLDYAANDIDRSEADFGTTPEARGVG